jgi:hypothetical protein
MYCTEAMGMPVTSGKIINLENGEYVVNLTGGSGARGTIQKVFVINGTGGRKRMPEHQIIKNTKNTELTVLER